MTGVVTCVHDWQREADPKSPTNVTLTCRRCGASSVARGKVRGKTVTASLELYPARGTTILDPTLYEFFIRQWEASCTALTQSGFMVDRRPPIVYTQNRGSTGGTMDRKNSRFATGRDILIASAIVLIAGSLMLAAGIYIDGLEWLRLAGGISLGVLFFLLLLVVFLSS